MPILDTARDLDDYWQRVLQLLEGYGAFLLGGHLNVERVRDADGVVRAIKIGPNRALFYDHSKLDFTMWVGDDLERTKYFAAHLSSDGTVAWRKCKHLGHEATVGGLTHLHCPPDEVPEPFGDVDLEEILNEVWDTISGETSPCEGERTQRTERGYQIPIPQRHAVLRDTTKVAKGVTDEAPEVEG